MNAISLKSLLALLPMLLVFCESLFLVRKEKTLFATLQLLGAGCLLMVALVHICEALQVFSFMQWGMPHSLGCYMDLCCAILGCTLLPIGYLFGAATLK
jgi:hypothetical protein